MAREMKRIKAPGPALSTLQKNKKSINCDSSCAQYEGVPTSFSGSLEF